MDHAQPIRPRFSRRVLLQQSSALAAAGLIAGGGRAASAGTPTTPPANVRVSRDDGPGHVEPHVAVNPAQPNNLLGTAQVIAAVGPTAIGTYTSFDGGQTWQDNGLLPYPPGSTDGNDVTVAFDAAGHGFVAAMATSRADRYDRNVAVWRTDDGGRTFAQPVVAVAHQFVDHPWLAIDRASGTLYLTWVARDDSTGAGFTRSTDGGATFDPPQDAAYRPGRVKKPAIAAGPNGAVHIAYETSIDEGGASDDAAADSDGVGAIDSWTELVSSADGGITFGDPLAIAQVPHEPVLPGDVHLPTGPSLATEPDGGVVLAYGALRPETDQVDVMLAHAAGVGQPLGLGPPVRINNTPDGDSTAFFQPQVVVDETGALAVTAFALKDGRVDVVLWQAAGPEGTFDAGQPITSESFDPAAGITSIDSVPVTKHGVWWIGDYQGLATGGGTLHALWNDTRTGNLQLFAAAIPIPTDAS
jgi:hypothetical protein